MALDEKTLDALKSVLRSMVREICEGRAGIREVHLRPWIQFHRSKPGESKMTHSSREDLAALAGNLTAFIRREYHTVIGFVTSQASLCTALRIGSPGDADAKNRVLQELISPVVDAYFSTPSIVTTAEYAPGSGEHIDAMIRQVRRIEDIRYDEDSLNVILDQVALELQTQRVPLILLSPLANVRLTGGPIELRPRLRLRQIGQTDAERWLNVSKPPLAVGENFAANWLECAIEESWEQSLDDSVSVGVRDDARRILTALRLLTDNETRIAMAFSELLPQSVLWRRRFPAFGFGPTQPWIASLLEVESSMETELRAVWTRLKDSPNVKRLDIAVRRWDGANERWKADDRLIDYWIAIESLFTTDSRHEIRYRARIRVAAFVGKSQAERNEIYERVGDSDDTRSDLVHGSSVAEKRLKEDVAATRSYLRRGVLQILESEQVFDPTQIDKRLLGAS